MAPPDPATGPVTLLRALGLLDLAIKAKRDGKKLAFIDQARGTTSEVAW